ncbi:MAG: sulfide-dependent adenosine diphosphate thiazole synthase [candidate division WOR-3 bacterium]
MKEKQITEIIIRNHFERLLNVLESDVIIAGGGPSSLTAAFYLAKAGKKVVVLERKLSLGGGTWGGGMGFKFAVVEGNCLEILKDMGIRYKHEGADLYSVDSIELASGLIFSALQAGAEIFNLVSVEDLVLSDGRVKGVVINSSPIEIAKLHVDPITLMAKAVVDATGHDLEVVRVFLRKNNVKLYTETGDILGERSMDAEEGEKITVEKTGEVFPGLYVAGMAACACFGGPRMGPIFGGMLLSGRKLAEILKEKV